jgi:hypothetical protein
MDKGFTKKMYVYARRMRVNAIRNFKNINSFARMRQPEHITILGCYLFIYAIMVIIN